MMKSWGAVRPSSKIFDAAAAGVVEGVARNFGDSGGDARLILSVEAEQARDLAGALAGGDGIVLDGECLTARMRSSRSIRDQLPSATTTVASS